MYKIWLRTIKKDKMVINKTFAFDDEFEPKNFSNIVASMCHSLDLPNPVILSYHVRNFDKFHTVSFKKDDFVEKVGFDKMTIEYCLDEKPSKFRVYGGYLPVD